jgi:glycine cleavage system H protein
MPISGVVEEVNPELDGQPDVVNKDPYGAGWMIKVKMTDLSQVNELLTAEQYSALIG